MEEITEDYFRQIVENAGDTVWLLSNDRETVEFINRDISGVTRREILENGFSAIWPVMEIDGLNLLLGVFEEAITAGKARDNIRTVHRNALTGQEEHYLHSVIPVWESGGSVSHVQVTSTDITALARTRRLVEILNSVSIEVQHWMLSPDLFRRVGEKLRKYNLSIAVLVTQDGATVRLWYTSIPKRKLKKALALLGKERVLKGIPIDEWGGVMNMIRRKKAQFWDDPHAFLLSRLHDPVYRKNLDTVVELLGLKRVIVTPMVVGREVLGSLVMTSDTLTELDLEAARTFAAQFSHSLVNARTHQYVQRIMGYMHELRENLEEGIFVVDERSVIVSWNKAAKSLLGYGREDVIGNGVLDATGIDKSLWAGLEQEILSGCNVHRDQVPLKASDGSWKEFSLSAIPVESDTGARPGTACTFFREGGG